MRGGDQGYGKELAAVHSTTIREPARVSVHQLHSELDNPRQIPLGIDDSELRVPKFRFGGARRGVFVILNTSARKPELRRRIAETGIVAAPVRALAATLREGVVDCGRDAQRSP